MKEEDRDMVNADDFFTKLGANISDFFVATEESLPEPKTLVKHEDYSTTCSYKWGAWLVFDRDNDDSVCGLILLDLVEDMGGPYVFAEVFSPDCALDWEKSPARDAFLQVLNDNSLFMRLLSPDVVSGRFGIVDAWKSGYRPMAVLGFLNAHGQ